MKNVCKLHLCIIGSTNFGKSSIAASLIHIAATTDGSIHLLGSPTKILKMADDLAANGQHVATGWDDIAKFQFQLQGNAGKSWQISLHDYPGALFAKYVERPSFAERMKNLFSRKAHTAPDSHVFDPTAERKASKLIAKLERADALIVLVPADVGDAKYRNDCLSYKQKLPEFIEKVLKNRPYTPVCLCINKWDMFDCGVEKLEDKLKETPFKEFKQSLDFACDGEVLCAAISAFGHHDPGNKEKIDKNQEQKPLNVLETLLMVAEQAEKARFERSAEAWRHSSLWQKTFFAPFRMTALLNAGNTDKNIHAELRKMTMKAWGFFALFILTTGAVAIGTVTAGLCINETIGFGKLQSQLAEYEKTPYSVEKSRLEDMLDELNRPTVMRHLFFSSKIGALREQLDKIEKKYNDSILEKAKAFRENNADLKPWGNPEDRIRRAESRKEYLEKAKGKLTLKASIHELDKLIKTEKSLLEDLSQNKDFYKQAYCLVTDNDETTICRRIRSFIDDHKPSHPEQKELFEEFERALDEKEKNIAGKLKHRIEEYQKFQPRESMNAEEKRTLDQYLIGIIDKAEKQFAEGSKNFKPFAEQRVKFSDDVEYQNVYGRFDEVYKKLDKNNLKEVVGFLSKYTKDSYPKREKTFESLGNLKQSLTEEICQQLKNQLKNNPDKPENAPSERIRNCRIRILACQDAIDKLVAGSDELRKVTAQKQNEKNKLLKLEKYQELDTKITELLNGDEKGKIRRIEAFLKEYHESDYPDAYFQEKFGALKTRENDLLEGLEKKLKASLEQNKEDLGLSAKENVQRAKKRASAYEEAKKEYAEGSDKWKDANDGKLEADRSAQKWEPYVAFEKEFDEIEWASENEKLKKIDVFVKTFKEREFTLRAKCYEKIRDFKKNTEKTLSEKLNTELGKLSKPGMKDFSARIGYYERESKIFGRFRDYYPEGSSAFMELERRKSNAIAQKEKCIKWNELHQRAEQIKSAKQQNAKDILPMIKSFLRDFQKNKDDAEVNADIQYVSLLQMDKAAEIHKELEDQLYRLEDFSTENEKQEACKNNCLKIDEKLGLLEGTSYYEWAQGQWAYFNNMCDSSKREQAFTELFKKFQTSSFESLQPQEKVEEISNFLERSWTDEIKKKHSADFGNLKREIERYTRETEWAKIDEDLVHPDENDVDSLIRYREKCRSLMAKAQQYKEYPYLKFRVEQKCKKAKEEIDWVKEQIGSGIYRDVVEKENVYKEAPSYESYKKLELVLKAFDKGSPENKDLKEKVENIRKRSERYHGIVQKFNRFVNEPTKTNWIDFSNKVTNQKEYPGYPGKYFEIAQTLNQYLNNETVAITLKSWNFRGTKFHIWGDVDCYVWISKSVNSVSDLYCFDIWGGDWSEKDSPKHNTARNLTVEIPAKTIAYVQFANKDGKNIYSQQIPLNIYRILVEARKEGKCSIDLFDTAPGGGSITLEFSGLPKF